MKLYETLIPTVISMHYEVVAAYGLRFEGHTMVGPEPAELAVGSQDCTPKPTVTGSGRT